MMGAQHSPSKRAKPWWTPLQRWWHVTGTWLPVLVVAQTVGVCAVNYSRHVSAQTLTLSCRNHLTTQLRDKTLPEEERKVTELQWVAFSSCLELFYADMCKVYHMGNCFSVANNSATVQTGMQGGTTEVAAHALSMPDLQEEHGEQTASIEGLEQSQLEQEISQVDRTLEDMEMKVNVLRWTVEARGPQNSEPLSSDSASLALLCTDEEEAQAQFCDRSQMFVVMLLGSVATVAVALSLCVVFLV